MKTTFFAIILTLIMGFSTAANAEVWKMKRPDGSYEYGNGTMPAGATPVDVKSNSPAVIPSYKYQAPIDWKRTPSHIESRTEPENGVSKARNALEKAEKALAEGEEPLPGERVGTFGGGKTRLGEAYFERQERLRADVEKAKENLRFALDEQGKNK